MNKIKLSDTVTSELVRAKSELDFAVMTFGLAKEKAIAEVERTFDLNKGVTIVKDRAGECFFYDHIVYSDNFGFNIYGRTKKKDGSIGKPVRYVTCIGIENNE